MSELIKKLIKWSNAGISMKPKKVMCPICGEEMIAESWGIYICTSCGNHVDYEGTESCWEFREM